jgi:hypothetical protein
MRNIASKNYSDSQFHVQLKKAKYRDKIVKQFQTASFHLQQSSRSQKPETILRTLRSFRLKMLHLYCNAVQKEVYADSIKI